MRVQVPSVILPRVWRLGTETEGVADAVTHISIEFSTRSLQEKNVQIIAQEVIAAGFPGQLWAWIELSPYLTTTTPLYWAAIGGGGGFFPPTVPLVIVGTGITLTVHSFMIPWVIHSEYARLVIQTPVPGVAAGWLVQAQFSAK